MNHAVLLFQTLKKRHFIIRASFMFRDTFPVRLAYIDYDSIKRIKQIMFN